MTPEMAAMKDFKDGMGADCNPYPKGTEQHDRWQARMNELLADELNREMMELSA